MTSAWRKLRAYVGSRSASGRRSLVQRHPAIQFSRLDTAAADWSSIRTRSEARENSTPAGRSMVERRPAKNRSWSEFRPKDVELAALWDKFFRNVKGAP
jgi:hypothetical protein